MLEQQQSQLVSGLQEMYQRLFNGQRWPGPKLEESSGHPLTHDMLAALNLLETKHDGSGELETFEKDCQKLQSRLLADGAGYMHRRGSIISDSEHSQHGNHKTTPQCTLNIAKPSVFKENFSFSTSPSPLAQSPLPRQRQSYPPAHQSPLHQSCQFANDPQLYQPEWSISEPRETVKSNFAMPVPQLQPNLDEVEDLMDNSQWESSPASYDLSMTGLNSYPQQLSTVYGTTPGMQDFGVGFDTMDIDVSKFIQVAT